MIVREGTNSARIVRALQSATAPLTTRQLAIAAGVQTTCITHGSRGLVADSYVLRTFDANDKRRVLWVIGLPCTIHPERRAAPTRRAHDAVMRDRMREPIPEAVLVTKLRDLFFMGQDAATGDPLQLLADALKVAREVTQAKDKSRFAGAEVERFVGRELRSISLAIMKATHNMRSALESTIAAEPPPRSQPCRVPSTSSTSTSSSTTSPLPSGAGCVTA